MPIGQYSVTSIYEDIKKVVEKEDDLHQHVFRGILHTTEDDVVIFKITSLFIMRDYISNIGDYINVSFKIGLGDYIYKIHPHRKNMEFSLKKITNSSFVDKDEAIKVKKYKAILSENDSNSFSGSGIDLKDIETLNSTQFVDINLQLLDRSLEPIRIKTTSGTFRKTDILNLMKTQLVVETNKILIEGKISLDSMDIVLPDNKKIYNSIVIKEGTLITDLPFILQKYKGGVYSSGLGSYIQKYNNKLIWFIYPLYSTKIIKKNIKIIIYNTNNSAEIGVGNSFNIENDIITIISDQVYITNISDEEYMNKGSGVKLSDGSKFMSDNIDITKDDEVSFNNKIKYNVNYLDRADKLNYSPVGSNFISSNPYVEHSKIIARSVSVSNIIWENGDQDLIHPGMPFTYVYVNDNKIKEVNGIIISTRTVIKLKDSSLLAVDSRYKTTVIITAIFSLNDFKPNNVNKDNIGEF